MVETAASGERVSACRNAWLARALLLLLVAAVYAPVRHHAFVNFDDPKYVYENPQVLAGLTASGARWAFTTFHAANWHPLTWLSHMLDVELFGASPGAHHLVNVALHAAATLLLFTALRMATGALWRSAFVAAFFAVHPCHVESVAWIAERKDVLSGALWSLTLVAYVWYAWRPSARRFAPVVVAFALGLLAKPMLVSLPLVLLLLDAWPLRRYAAGASHTATALRLVGEKAPLLALSAASCVVTYLAQSGGGAVSSVAALPLTARVANAVLSYGTYLVKLAWPSGLAVIYPHPAWTPDGISSARVAAAALALVATTALVVVQRVRRPHLAVGWMWFLVTLVPVIGLVQVGSHAMADRYTYLPATGLFVAIAWGLGELASASVRWRHAAVALSALAVLALAGVARDQTAHWRDSLTLFRRALDVTRHNSLAWQNLGTAHLAGGDREQAVHAFREAVRIDPGDFVNWMNLGSTQLVLGQHRAAVESFRAALRLRPRELDAAYNVAIASLELRDYAAAIDALELAVSIDGENPRTWHSLGLAHAYRGDTASALRIHHRIAALDPALAETYLRRVREVAAAPAAR